MHIFNYNNNNDYFTSYYISIVSVILQFNELESTLIRRICFFTMCFELNCFYLFFYKILIIINLLLWIKQNRIYLKYHKVWKWCILFLIFGVFDVRFPWTVAGGIDIESAGPMSSTSGQQNIIIIACLIDQGAYLKYHMHVSTSYYYRNDKPSYVGRRACVVRAWSSKHIPLSRALPSRLLNMRVYY